MNRDTIKKEIAGVALGIVAFFYIGALLFYHVDDAAVLEPLQWYEFFGRNAMEAAAGLHNPFGIFGARLSELFIRSFLGYVSVIPGFAAMYWGWSLLFGRSLKLPLIFTLYAILIALDIATMFGLTTAPFGDIMAGAVGRMLAAFLSTVIGYTGAWILLAVLGLAASLFALRVFVENPLEKLRFAGAAAKTLFAGLVTRKPAVPLSEDPADSEVPEEEEPQQYSVPEEMTRQPVVSAEEVTAEEPDTQEPQISIREGVHEKEADLDKRKLKVKTKDRVVYRFPSVDILRYAREEDYIDETLLEESKKRLLEKLGIYKIEVVRIAAWSGLARPACPARPARLARPARPARC